MHKNTIVFYGYPVELFLFRGSPRRGSFVYNRRVDHTEKKENASAKILSCIPISRGMGREELSYFTLKDVSRGCLVSVPLRRRQVPAIVVGVENALFSKTELKSLPFGLRKIGNVKARAFLLPAFIESAREAARYFATTTGAVLSSFTPTALSSECGTNIPKETLGTEKDISTQARENATKHIPLLIQSADEERIAAYRGIIREEFARGGSVFVCLPEITEIERLSEALSRGIPEYTFVFHSGISGKKLAALWTKALSEKHPILIVGTGQFFSLPRADIHTIIVEKESSRAYKTITRPYADIRIFAEIFARKLRARLIWRSFPPHRDDRAQEKRRLRGVFSARISHSHHCWAYTH